MIIGIMLIILIFSDIKTNDLAKIREGLSSKDNLTFIQNVENVIKIEKQELSEEFKKFLILKAIEKYDEELLPLKKNTIFNDMIKFFETLLGNPKEDYRRAILNLFIYVCTFTNSGYEEELLNRLVTKELIKANPGKIISIIKERKKEVMQNENLRKAIYFLLLLSNKKLISLTDENQQYLKNVFEDTYNKLGEENKCNYFDENSEIFKVYFSVKDEKIINDAKICICKEKDFSDVLSYYFSLLENKIKGADKLIDECLVNIKDENIKNILKRYQSEYLEGNVFKLTYDDFIYLANNSHFKNPCCE